MKSAVVDRVEGKIAVLLIDGQPLDVPVAILPRGTREGDYLQVEIENGEMVAVERDDAAAEAAKKRIADKLNRLRRGEHLMSEDDTD